MSTYFTEVAAQEHNEGMQNLVGLYNKYLNKQTDNVQK